MPNHPTLAIANEFLRRANADRRTLTQMQLQKLVYLAHGWTLAATHQSLVDDAFEAWDYGPVVRRLYNATNMYGARPIPALIRWGQDTPFRSDDDGEANTVLTAEESAIIDHVWRTYGQFEAFRLSAITHEPNSPWTHAFREGRNAQISDDDIRAYFEQPAHAG